MLFVDLIKNYKTYKIKKLN